GLWDWTETDQLGTLEWGFGGGGGLVSRFGIGEKFILEGGINFVYVQAGQTLDAEEYTFTQMSLELPVLFKTRLPFENTSWYIGAGPSLIFLPFEAYRNDVAQSPDKPVMLALQAGLDWSLFNSEKSEILLSGNFIHPVTSPSYKWEETSSGSIRINRLELCVTWLLNMRGRNQ
ncbi:MAG: hypothetical protein PQJ58_13070, partial [Spirochaetales bacterium]|nr:hypothetical protein [Spirochaetales bacterium]